MMQTLDVHEQHRKRQSILLVALQMASDRSNPSGRSLLATNVSDLDLRCGLHTERLGRCGSQLIDEYCP